MSRTICGVQILADGSDCQMIPNHWHDQLTPHRIYGPYGNGDWIEYAEEIGLDGHHRFKQTDRASLHRSPASVAKQDKDPRRFTLERTEDISGVSGLGTIAYGVVWPDGRCSIHWPGIHPSTVAWDCLHDAMAVHGHGGATTVNWLDGHD